MLRLNVHAPRDVVWSARASSFAGITTLAIAVGEDEMLIFLSPDQIGAARSVAEAINAAFAAPPAAAPVAQPNPEGSPPCGA